MKPNLCVVIMFAAFIFGDWATIGYCILPVDLKTGTAVVAAIVPPGKHTPAVPPSRENILSGNYPLLVKIDLLLHPKASERARQFCNYVGSDKAAKTIRESGFFPASEIAESGKTTTRPATRPSSGPRD